jgi:hypothetical protein
VSTVDKSKLCSFRWLATAAYTGFIVGAYAVRFHQRPFDFDRHWCNATVTGWREAMITVIFSALNLLMAAVV